MPLFLWAGTQPVSLVNCLLTLNRFDPRMVYPRDVVESACTPGTGVTAIDPADWKLVPDPRNRTIPKTLAGLKAECDLLAEWMLAGHLPWSARPRPFVGAERVVKGQLEQLIREAVDLGMTVDEIPSIDRLDETKAKAVLNKLRQWAAVALGGSGPAKHRTGRPKKTEKDSATKVIAALSKHHGYENGSVTNYAPATNRGLAGQYRLGGNALSRFLKERFPKEAKPHKKYEAACRDGSLGALLMFWNRELPSCLPDLLPHDRAHEDED
jgi:hypothetical protein